MKFLEAISPKNKTRNQEETEIFDLISSVDSPVKGTTEVFFIGKTGRKDDGTKANENDDETNEEEEKQTENDNKQ